MIMQKRVVSLLIRSVMAVLLGIALALLLNTESVAGDIKLDTIKTKTDLYQNVTVTGHNSMDIFIVCDQGMANVKIKDLDAETLWRVGLGEKPLEPGSSEALAAAEAAKNNSIMPAALTKVFESASLPMVPTQPTEQIGESGEPGTVPPAWLAFKPGTEQFKQMLVPLSIALAITLGVYLFVCYCLKLIVKKAGAEPGFLIWLPVLQLIPMLKAAGMSLVWFFLWISPVVVTLAIPLVMLSGDPSAWAKSFQIISLVTIPASILQLIAALVWTFKIVQARGKSLWVALFLILPITNLFAFLYLAFSDSDSVDRSDDQNGGRIVIEPAFAEA